MLQYESHSTQDIPDGPTDLTTDELSALFDESELMNFLHNITHPFMSFYSETVYDIQ